MKLKSERLCGNLKGFDMDKMPGRSFIVENNKKKMKNIQTQLLFMVIFFEFIIIIINHHYCLFVS